MDILITILSIVSPIAVVVTFFITRHTDAKNKGKEEGRLTSDVAHIKERVDSFVYEQRRNNEIMTDITTRVTLVEASTKSAHKRIDEIKNNKH